MRRRVKADSLGGCIPVIASGGLAAGAAERQDVNSLGWSAAQPQESESHSPCRVAASQPPESHPRRAATRLLSGFVCNRGFRCAPPSAIQITPLRGGLTSNSHLTELHGVAETELHPHAAITGLLPQGLPLGCTSWPSVRSLGSPTMIASLPVILTQRSSIFIIRTSTHFPSPMAVSMAVLTALPSRTR